MSAPDVYMSCTYGLYRLSQRIPARGLKSSLLMDERVVEVGSSKLEVRDSDSSPYFMTIGYMTDLLYGLSEALHSALWNVEADIEIWDRTTRHHVGHGTLENRYTPRQAAGTTNRGKRDCDSAITSKAYSSAITRSERMLLGIWISLYIILRP